MEEVIRKIKELHAKRVLVHLPAGYGPRAPEIEKELGKYANILFWSEPAFGACDVPFAGARELKVDLIVAFGHTALPYNRETPVVFVEPKSGLKITKVPKLPWKKVGLLVSAQFLDIRDRAAELLKKKGYEVHWGKHGHMTTYDGQVVGCEFLSGQMVESKVDGFLLISEGKFHAQGLADTVNKPVLNWNPYTNEVEEFKKGKQWLLNLVKAKKRFGLLVTIKPLQYDEKQVWRVKELLEKAGKQVVLIAGDTFTTDIRNFPVDCLITGNACPRLEGDTEKFGKPIITMKEALEGLRVHYNLS